MVLHPRVYHNAWEATCFNMTDPHATYCRHDFWLPFVNESTYTLRRHRPRTLRPTISLPTVDVGSKVQQVGGKILEKIFVIGSSLADTLSVHQFKLQRWRSSQEIV